MNLKKTCKIDTCKQHAFAQIKVELFKRFEQKAIKLKISIVI